MAGMKLPWQLASKWPIVLSATRRLLGLRRWAVICGNYYPREVDSVWRSELAADRRAEALGGMWTVEEWR